jgi:hypothetical protein
MLLQLFLPNMRFGEDLNGQNVKVPTLTNSVQEVDGHLELGSMLLNILRP